jgi:hypothetical protein
MRVTPCSLSERFIRGRPHWTGGDVGLKANLDTVVARIKNPWTWWKSIPGRSVRRQSLFWFIPAHPSTRYQCWSQDSNGFLLEWRIVTLGQSDPLDDEKDFSSRWQIEYVSSFIDLQITIIFIRHNGYVTAPCSRVPCEKLKVAQIFKIFPVFYEIWIYVTVFTSSTSGPCPQTSEFIDIFTDYLLRLYFNIFLPSTSRFRSVLIPSDISARLLYKFPISTTRDIYFAHLILLNLIT